MVLLEAAMAFAVVMIIFSTVTTGVVEFLHRSIGSRERHLKRALKYLFDEMIWPRLSVHLDRLHGESDDKCRIRHRRKFVYAMTENPLAMRIGLSPDSANPSKGSLRKGRTNTLTPTAFAERLARTDAGRAILEEGEEQLDLLLKDFVRTFDRLGRIAAEVLTSRARATAMVVGILLALSVNVDAGRLFTTLTENPDLRTGLIEQAEEANKESVEARKSLEEVVAKVEAGTALAPSDLDRLKGVTAAVNSKVDILEAQGLPIGFAFYPWCNAANLAGACADMEKGKFLANAKKDELLFLRWVAFCLLSGLLIGLGGPFWFRVFTNLSQLGQILRSVGIGRREKVAEANAGPPVDETVRPRDVADAFRVAAAVHNQSSSDRERVLLAPDGEAL